ncbi:unnamed protein product [Symbiodinium sp. CCMP2592]|nr:unnamed protein product [Symbiodinium sp. CCMP2592]
MVSPETRDAWTADASIGDWWRRQVEAASARPFLPVHDTIAAIAFVAQARGDDLSQSAPFQRLTAWAAPRSAGAESLSTLLHAVAVPEEGHYFPAAIQEGLLTLLLGHNGASTLERDIAALRQPDLLPLQLRPPPSPAAPHAGCEAPAPQAVESATDTAQADHAGGEPSHTADDVDAVASQGGAGHSAFAGISAAAWSSLDAVDLAAEFGTPVPTMQSVPAFLRAGVRQALVLALRALREAYTRGTALQQTRAWKLFLLAPRLLLHRARGSGTVGREALLQRTRDFLAGRWEALLGATRAAAAAPRARIAADATAADNEASRERRRALACANVPRGEVSRARVALTSAAIAPGAEDAFAALSDPERRPPEPLHDVPAALLNLQPDAPAVLTDAAVAQAAGRTGGNRRIMLFLRLLPIQSASPSVGSTSPRLADPKTLANLKTAGKRSIDSDEALPAEEWQWERTGESAWLQQRNDDVLEVSSDEDEDGHVKPLLGDGNWGRGPPLTELLKILTRHMDLKSLASKLVQGKITANPFSSSLVAEGRDLLFTALEYTGAKLPVREKSEGQPFYLAAVEELLRISGDPDSRVFFSSSVSFAKGVRLGPGATLPRVPAVFEKKEKWRKYDVESCTRFTSSMIEVTLQEAQKKFGDRLAVASLDQLRSPCAGELRTVLQELSGQCIGLTGDVKRAHRLSKIAPEDWGLQACKTGVGGQDKLWLNKVGTFGISSAAYHWSRLMSGLGRAAFYMLGKTDIFMLVYVDDILWLVRVGENGMEKVCLVIYFFVLMALFRASVCLGSCPGPSTQLQSAACNLADLQVLGKSARWRRQNTEKELFRTDAKAEGNEVWIAGWALDSEDTKQCRWFSERLDHISAPWVFLAGEAYRQIASLELLATLAAVVSFGVPTGENCGFLCSAATDNRGNSNLVARLLTTKFPLCVLLMELAVQLQDRGADLKLHWLPRLQNEEADSLTNGEYSRFDSRRRVRFDLRSFKGLVMQDLLCAGMDLYEEVRNSRAHKSAVIRSKQPRQAALRVTDPWQ